jgi:response regulator NasT
MIPIPRLWRDRHRRYPSPKATRDGLALKASARISPTYGRATIELIEQIVRNAACPVILVLDTKDSNFVNEAAKRGIFAYLVDGEQNELQSALDIVLRRLAEYHNLEGAFGRRAIIERAKGILMAVHGIDEQRAFELLRSQSQREGRKLVDIAEAITQTHRLLVPNPGSASE